MAREGLFTYRAVVRAEGGAASARSNRERIDVTAPTPADTTPPPIPTGLTATQGDAHIELTWRAVSAADLASYVVYQRSAGGTWARVADVVGESVIIQGLENGAQYAFAVSAVDTADNESDLSTTLFATPVAPDTTPPPVPTGVAASGGDAEVTVRWESVAAPDVAGYVIYSRPTVNGFWLRAADTGSLATAATVTALTNGTSYDFAVSALDRTGNESALSTRVTATPIAPPPVAPTSLSATAGDAQVQLAWDAVPDPIVVGYRVYLRTSAQDAWMPDPDGLAPTTDTVVSGLTNGVEYHFAVAAVTADGTESEKSSTATATPVPAP